MPSRRSRRAATRTSRTLPEIGQLATGQAPGSCGPQSASRCSTPIHLAGDRAALTVTVRDTVTGETFGEFLFVADNGHHSFVVDGHSFADLDNALRRLCQRPEQRAA
jgi:hypothetical protein